MRFLLQLIYDLKIKFLLLVLILNVFLDTILVMSVSTLLSKNIASEITDTLGLFVSSILSSSFFEIFLFTLLITRFFTTRYSLITLDRRCVDLEHSIRDKMIQTFLLSDKKVTNEKQTEFYSNVLMWSQLLSVNLFVPLVRIASDTIFLVCVILYSVLLSPEVGIGFATLILLVGIPFYVMQRMKNIDRKSDLIELQNSITAMLIEVFNNKTSIKLFPNSLARIIDRKVIQKYTVTRARLLTIARLPKLYVESLLFGLVIITGIVAKLGMSVEQYFSLSSLIPILIAMFRIAPSITGYLSFISIYSELRDVLQKIQQETINGNFSQRPDLIKVKKINEITIVRGTKAFSKKNEPIFDNLNFTFEIGKVNIITGASGTGKSTLVNCILNVEKLDQGEILYDRRKLDPRWSNFASICTQEHTIVRGNLEQNASLFTSNHDRDLLLKLIKDLNLTELDLYADLEKVALSGGQKQRIGILRAIIANTPVIIFDEPTSALDKNNAEIVIEKIACLARRHLVIVITHQPSLFCLNTRCLQM